MTTAPAYPFHVKAWPDWTDSEPAHDSYHRTREDAIAAARALPYPLVDVSEYGPGIFAQRRMVAHPSGIFTARDDFAEPI